MKGRLTAASDGSATAVTFDGVGFRAREMPLVPARVRALLGLAVLLCSELTLVAIVSGRASVVAPPSSVHFASWRAGPLTGFAPHLSFDRLRVTFLVLLAVMALGYALLLSGRHALSARMAIGGILVAHAIVFIGPPLVLTDIFNYVNYGRIGAVHHLNPYTHVPALSDQHDAAYRYTSWRYQATPYGPLFTLATYPFAKLGVASAVWSLKAMAVCASLACAALVAGCAKRLGRPPVACAIAVAMNPVLLVYGVGGAHNDFLMMALLLAGLYWTLGRRDAVGPAAAVASVAVKASTAILAPFVILMTRRRGLAVLAAAGTAAALSVLMITLFGVRAPGLTDQASTTTTFSLPSVFASIFGMRLTTHCSSAHYGCATTAAAVGTAVVFVAAFAALLWRAARGGDPLACAGWAAVALLLTLTSVMPWYLLWILPFAVLSRSRALLTTSAVLALWLVVTSQPASHLLIYGA